MLSLQTGIHWAIGCPQAVEELFTQTFMKGQQKPSIHWSPVRHFWHVPTDFLGVQSDTALTSDVSSGGVFGFGKIVFSSFFCEQFSSSSLSKNKNDLHRM